MKINSMAICDGKRKRTELNVNSFLNWSSTRRFTVRSLLGILRRFEWRS